MQPEARFVLVVDQFEEMLPDSSNQIQRFVEALSSFARSGRVFVIVTLRSDFYHHCAAIPELIELQEGAGQYHLLPPTAAEIGQLIRLPARAAGLRFDDGPEGDAPLDDTLRDAAAGNPEFLPLLEFTLDELYKRRRDGRVLTREVYDELGGVEGALATRADEVFGGLLNKSEKQARDALKTVFRKLVKIGPEDADKPTGRPANRDELPTDSVAVTLVDEFVEARLLVTISRTMALPSFESPTSRF